MPLVRPARTSAGGWTKCTPEVTKIICDTIREGHYISTAAQAAGIANHQLYVWMQRGEAGEEPFRTFTTAIKQAYAEGELTLGSYVVRDAKKPGGWIAAMTYLERTRPERYGRRDRVTVDQTTRVVFQNQTIELVGDNGEVERVTRQVSAPAQLTQKAQSGMA